MLNGTKLEGIDLGVLLWYDEYCYYDKYPHTAPKRSEMKYPFWLLVKIFEERINKAQKKKSGDSQDKMKRFAKWSKK